MTLLRVSSGTKNKSNEKDDRMIHQYFQKLQEYYKKYGKKTILLWQCGGFYEVYTVKDPISGEFLISNFSEYLQITRMNAANKHLKYKHNEIEFKLHTKKRNQTKKKRYKILKS